MCYPNLQAKGDRAHRWRQVNTVKFDQITPVQKDVPRKYPSSLFASSTLYNGIKQSLQALSQLKWMLVERET